MNFAENLQILRRKHGLTQEGLAEIMGVSRQAVSKWEQGEGYPEAEKLLILVDRFGVSIDGLMGLAPLDSAQAAYVMKKIETLQKEQRAEVKWTRLWLWMAVILVAGIVAVLICLK